MLHAALEKVQATYRKQKQSGSKASEKTMCKLAWQVKELDDLSKLGRKLSVEISALAAKAADSKHNLITSNMARQLTEMRTSLTDFVKRLTCHRRTAATHILVLIHSCESRRHKPYAFPVQCLPIRALKDQQVPAMATNRITETMKKRNMHVAGLFHILLPHCIHFVVIVLQV